MSLRLVGLALLVCTVRAEAQGLRDQISQLFVFGAGQTPLFLEGSSAEHGGNFVPATAAGNAAIIAFVKIGRASCRERV